MLALSSFISGYLLECYSMNFLGMILVLAWDTLQNDGILLVYRVFQELDLCYLPILGVVDLLELLHLVMLMNLNLDDFFLCFSMCSLTIILELLENLDEWLLTYI